MLLKVRLDKIAEIINRVLTTIDHHPEIVAQVVPPLAARVGELGQAAGDEVADAATTAVGDAESAAAGAAGDTSTSDAESDESSAEPDHEGSRGLLRRRKQEGTGEEPPS